MWHLMLSTGDSNQIQTRHSLIKGSLCEKLLGVKFDYKLTFDYHVRKKENAKLKTLAWFVPYMGLAKKKLQINFLSAAQFNYCPLIWMDRTAALIATKLHVYMKDSSIVKQR